MTLEDMKNSYPVQITEYAVQRCIAGDPVFSWWIQHVLLKCNCIIVKLKSKYLVLMHKFFVDIPKSVQEGKSFDKENRNTFWWDTIYK